VCHEDYTYENNMLGIGIDDLPKTTPKIPILLTCAHTICLQCVRDISEQTDINMKCPQCEENISNNIDALIYNVNTPLGNTATDHLPRCNECNHAAATYKCTICDIILCAEDVDIHKRRRRGTKHEIQSEGFFLAERLCKTHEKVFSSICESCNNWMLCVDCLGEHDDCKKVVSLARWIKSTNDTIQNANTVDSSIIQSAQDNIVEQRARLIDVQLETQAKVYGQFDLMEKSMVSIAEYAQKQIESLKKAKEEMATKYAEMYGAIDKEMMLFTEQLDNIKSRSHALAMQANMLSKRPQGLLELDSIVSVQYMQKFKKFSDDLKNERKSEIHEVPMLQPFVSDFIDWTTATDHLTQLITEPKISLISSDFLSSAMRKRDFSQVVQKRNILSSYNAMIFIGHKFVIFTYLGRKSVVCWNLDTNQFKVIDVPSTVYYSVSGPNDTFILVVSDSGYDSDGLSDDQYRLISCTLNADGTWIVFIDMKRKYVKCMRAFFDDRRVFWSNADKLGIRSTKSGESWDDPVGSQKRLSTPCFHLPTDSIFMMNHNTLIVLHASTGALKRIVTLPHIPVYIACLPDGNLFSVRQTDPSAPHLSIDVYSQRGQLLFSKQLQGHRFSNQNIYAVSNKGQVLISEFGQNGEINTRVVVY